MQRRKFLLGGGSVFGLALAPGCNDIMRDENKTPMNESTPTKSPTNTPSPDSDDVLAEFSGQGSTITDEFDATHFPSIIVEIWYGGSDEFTAHWHCEDPDEERLIVKTSAGFDGEYSINSPEGRCKIVIETAPEEQDVDWEVTVRKEYIQLH